MAAFEMIWWSSLEGRCLQRLEASETALGVASNSPPRVGQATRRSAVREKGSWSIGQSLRGGRSPDAEIAKKTRQAASQLLI